MPKISEFYGVAIRMHFNEHGPPHFHAEYQGCRASIGFDGSLQQGSLPRRALWLVRAWARLHGSELMENWSLARKGRPLVEIPPLE
jgi:hypothetical protein